MKGYFHIHRLRISTRQIPRSVGHYLLSISLWTVLTITAHAQLPGYSHVQEIYIDPAMVSGSSNLSNFPLLIHLTEDYLRSTGNGGEVTSASGYDIALSTDGTTQLDHEIESYNATTGEFMTWVNIPTLYHDRYTILYLSYGNGAVVSDPSSNGTWNADYASVWHLDENVTDEANGGTHQDATTANFDGTQYGNAETTGIFSDGQDFDGTDDHINAGAAPGSQTSITVSFWMKTDVDNAYQRAIGKTDVDAADDQGWSFMVRPAGEVGFDRGIIFRIGDDTDYGGWTNEVSAENVYTAGTWVYIVGTFAYNGSNGGTGTLYANGVNVASRSNTDGRGVNQTANSLYIGWDYWGDFYDTEAFDGTLDEVRIAGVARSADWIATEYNNQSNPTGFLSVGVPDGPGGVGSTDGSTNLTLWLDAGQITGVASGDAVATWSDLSGYGNNALTGNASPTYSSNGGGNQQPAVNFQQASKQNFYVPGNSQVLPTNEVSVFIAGNYEDDSDRYGGLISAVDDDAWNDGWGISEDNTTGNMLFFVDDYSATVCQHSASVDFGTDNIWALIYNSADGYGYKSESSCTFSFAGPINYDLGRNDDLLIGAAPNNTGANYFMTGDIEEVIEFDVAVNDAQRIIIANYLSAKYDITLSDNDVYKADQNVEGDFDKDVAGIGSLNGGVHNDAQGTGILRVLNPTDLDNDEFFMWGFSDGRMAAAEFSDVPTGVEARFEGMWRANELSASTETSVDVGSIDMIFDLSGLGDVTASDLRLIVDTDQDSIFANQTVISGATNIAGSLYLFSGVSVIDDNDLFTLGTADRSNTPLADFSSTGALGPGGVGETDGSSEMIMWLDANTVSQADGSDVLTWSDQSGYGNDAIGNELNDGSWPEFYSNGLNGYPEMTFIAANDDYFYTGSSASLNTTVVSAFVVGNLTNSSQSNGGFMIKDGGGWDDGWGIVRDGSNEQLFGWVTDYTTNFVTETALSYSVPAIHSLHYDKTQIEFYTNESTALTFAHTDDILQNANGIFIGWTSAYMDGDISEVVVFNQPVTDAQRIIIHNYLAAKYGRPLTNNDVYTMDDSGYDHDVAGIGQAADGSSHTEARGTGIIRMMIPTDLDNSEFLMWGHENGALTLTDSTDVPTGMTARLERMWAVGESGDVGAVDMIWDLSSLGITDASVLRLLVDTDNDGNFDDESAIRDASLVSGNTFRFAGVDALQNNLRFTLGVADQGPGGVSDHLVLWMKADEGVQVSGGAAADGEVPDTWLDQSGRGNDASQAVGTTYPTYTANYRNYNPAVHFPNGDNGFFELDLTDLDGTDYNVIAVVQRENSNGDNYFIGSVGAAANQALHIGYRSNNAATLGQYTDDLNMSVAVFDDPGDSLSLVRAQMDGGTGSPAGQLLYELRDGTATTGTDAVNVTHLTVSGTGRIGKGHNTQGFEGYICEVIAYDSLITDNELARIYSYLAMKYDFALESTDDILASDGSVLWDISAEPIYNNDLVVIGRDDQSLYHQKQSRSDDDSLRVYVGSLATNNPSNASSISNDLSYLVIGHNGGALSAIWNETEMPGTVTARFEREWKITNVNFQDTYNLEFEWEEIGPFDINDIRLLVDADGDFSDATIYGPADGLTFSVGSIIVEGVGTSQIPANSTMYVTVASVGTTPLPVELIHFKAVANQTYHTVDLSWSTASETDNDFFTIEKSQDAEGWTPTLIVPGAGNSSERIDYEATDNDPYYGLSYYRLKQTDYDGTSSYSDIVFVTLGAFKEELTVYPNPTQSLLTIKGSPEQLRSVAVIDAMGREVSGSVQMISRTETTITLDMSELPVGIFNILTADKSLKIIKSP